MMPERRVARPLTARRDRSPAARASRSGIGDNAMVYRWLGLAAAATLLGACNMTVPGISAGSSRACLAENAAFADAWTCVKARLAGHSDPKRQGLIEEGDVLASQVKAGKVSDAEARRRLLAGLAHEDGI